MIRYSAAAIRCY